MACCPVPKVLSQSWLPDWPLWPGSHMITHFDATGFAASALKLERFLPDGKRPDFRRLLEDIREVCVALEKERDDLAEEHRLRAEETSRLRDRLRRLGLQLDKLQGIFRVNAHAFATFRSALTLSQELRGLADLPEMIVHLGQALGVPFLACLLNEEDFGPHVPTGIPCPPRATLEAALAALPRQERQRTVFLGNVREVPQPDFFFGSALLAASPELLGGSCFIAPLVDKYRPARPIGALVMADSDPRRYVPDKGTDFLEHFCEIFSGDLQHVKTHEELTRQRELDELTGIPNRAFLSRHGPPLLSLAERKGSSVAMLFCDLDRFKAINDTFGHPVGDAVLIAAAQGLASRIRAYDLLARLGGDEFVLLLPDANQGQALAMAERVRGAVTEAIAAMKLPGAPALSVSIGVALHIPGQGIDDLVRRADEAMYTEKHSP